jgi:hypothetical protein
MDQHQLITVIVARGHEQGGNFLAAGRWVELQSELDSLVRRFGFELLTQMAGGYEHNGDAGAGQYAYQVTGMRRTPGLGMEAGHFDQINRELRDLLYLFKARVMHVGFGALERLDA